MVVALPAGKSLQRRILLSTDDPETVEYFNKSRAGWEVLHTRWNRSSDRNKSTLDFAQEPGSTAPDVFLSSLLDLSLVLECDAWVGDLVSFMASSQLCMHHALAICHLVMEQGPVPLAHRVALHAQHPQMKFFVDKFTALYIRDRCCAQASNWGRLMEELRATVRCKASNIYHDVRQSYPPDELGIHE